MKLLGIFKNANGEIESNLYFDWEEWHKDTFSPATEILTMILFKISGKTYAERKENLKQLAIDYQTNGIADLSYEEFMKIYTFFEKNAKRYGLLAEFRENGII